MEERRQKGCEDAETTKTVAAGRGLRWLIVAKTGCRREGTGRAESGEQAGSRSSGRVGQTTQTREQETITFAR